MSDLRDLEFALIIAKSRADFFKYWAISAAAIFAGIAVVVLGVFLLCGHG